MKEGLKYVGFEIALLFIKSGGKARRMSWDHTTMLWVYKINPTDYSIPHAFKTGYDDIDSNPPGNTTWIGMRTNRGFVPWTPSQDDILMSDWQTLADADLLELEAPASDSAGDFIGVTINTVKYRWSKPLISHFDVCRLAGLGPTADVTYRNSTTGESGELAEGDVVFVSPRTEFVAVYTDAA